MLAEKRKNIAWVMVLSKNTREVAVMVLNVSLITTHSIILTSQKDVKQVKMKFLKRNQSIKPNLTCLSFQMKGNSKDHLYIVQLMRACHRHICPQKGTKIVWEVGIWEILRSLAFIKFNPKTAKTSHGNGQNSLLEVRKFQDAMQKVGLNNVYDIIMKWELPL